MRDLAEYFRNRRTLTAAIRPPLAAIRPMRVLHLVLLALLVVLLLDRCSGYSNPFRLQASKDPELDALMTAIETTDTLALRKALHVPGLDLDRQDDLGNTALTRAAHMGWVQGVGLLLDRGADPNLSAECGGEPLGIATHVRGTAANQLVDLLIQHGAKVNIRGCGGQTPLINASIYHRPDVLAQLIASGANVNIAESNGRTALHSAAMSDDMASITLLLAAGAKPNAVDADGQTPLDMARACESWEAAQLLQGHLNAQSLMK